jgi:hypothetical protein
MGGRGKVARRYEIDVRIGRLPAGVDPASAKRGDYVWTTLSHPRSPWSEALVEEQVRAIEGAVGTRLVVSRCRIPEGQERNLLGKFRVHRRYEVGADGNVRELGRKAAAS